MTELKITESIMLHVSVEEGGSTAQEVRPGAFLFEEMYVQVNDAICICFSTTLIGLIFWRYWH